MGNRWTVSDELEKCQLAAGVVHRIWTEETRSLRRPVVGKCILADCLVARMVLQSMLLLAIADLGNPVSLQNLLLAESLIR